MFLFRENDRIAILIFINVIPGRDPGGNYRFIFHCLYCMDSPPAGRQAASAGMTIKEVNIDDLKKLNIPKNPGCYLFKDAKGKIIYVGKASDLRSRVSSYWRQSANHSPAKHAMMKQIAKVDWIETDSEIEALLLESNLIKKHAP